jgi:hypothetical protein
MAFIFNPERDPRREQVAEFKTGDKVRYRNMTVPAEILSGPHQSPGRERYLIRKGDGYVSLVSASDIERVVPRIDQVMGTLAMLIHGTSYIALNHTSRHRIAVAAARVLEIADNTKGQA